MFERPEHYQPRDEDEPDFDMVEEYDEERENYRPEEWRYEWDEPDVELSSITRELLVHNIPTTATICAVQSGPFSVHGYKFLVNRGSVYYDGLFFPSMQDPTFPSMQDPLPLAGIHSHLNAYHHSGQKIVEMHFKTPEVPHNDELYETDDIALEVLLFTLAPIFWRLEYDSVDQLELFGLAGLIDVAKLSKSTPTWKTPD